MCLRGSMLVRYKKNPKTINLTITLRLCVISAHSLSLCIFILCLFLLNRWEPLDQAASTNVTASLMKGVIVLQDNANVCQAGQVQLNLHIFLDICYCCTLAIHRKQ